jgi:hypothetical protein
LIARPIVALLKRAQLTIAKWQFPASRRKCLCCGTGRHNQLFKRKDVIVGNIENKHLKVSPSSDGWNSFKRQGAGRPSIDADTVETVREAFQCGSS